MVRAEVSEAISKHRKMLDDHRLVSLSFGSKEQYVLANIPLHGEMRGDFLSAHVFQALMCVTYLSEA